MSAVFSPQPPQQQAAPPGAAGLQNPSTQGGMQPQSAPAGGLMGVQGQPGPVGAVPPGGPQGGPLQRGPPVGGGMMMGSGGGRFMLT